ncbi:hypothetical protein SDC9_146440 [bioreactor metagenome]|uniref:Uncharacterized protein n=1 Tax=bioreactor metagenome TaxID=1076179 RepID=A0A645ED43_9ZZZZ
MSFTDGSIEISSGMAFIITSMLFSMASLPTKTMVGSEAEIPSDSLSFKVSSLLKLLFLKFLMFIPVGIMDIGFVTPYLRSESLAFIVGAITAVAVLQKKRLYS